MYYHCIKMPVSAKYDKVYNKRMNFKECVVEESNVFENSDLLLWFEWNIWRRNMSGLLVPQSGCEPRSYRTRDWKQWRFYVVRTFPPFNEKFKLRIEENPVIRTRQRRSPPLKWVHYAENMFRTAALLDQLHGRQDGLVTSLTTAPGSQVTSLCAQWGRLKDHTDNSICSSSRNSTIIIWMFISFLNAPVFTNAFFEILHIYAHEERNDSDFILETHLSPSCLKLQIENLDEITERTIQKNLSCAFISRLFLNSLGTY